MLSRKVLQLLLTHHYHLLRLSRYLFLVVQVDSLLCLFIREAIAFLLVLFVLQLCQMLPINIDANVYLFLLSHGWLLRLSSLAE